MRLDSWSELLLAADATKARLPIMELGFGSKVVFCEEDTLDKNISIIAFKSLLFKPCRR